MQVHPIANLEQRLQAYRRERHNFYAGTLPWFAVGGFATTAAFLYVVQRFAPGTFADDIVLTAATAAPFYCVIPWAVMRPRRPTQEDVLRDQALRRAHGMDDTVAR